MDKALLTGAALVASISALYPKATIAELLDIVSNIHLERIYKSFKEIRFLTIIHMIEYLIKKEVTLENIKIILGWFADDQDIPEEYRRDIRAFVAAGGVESSYVFIDGMVSMSRCCFSC